MFTQKDKKLWVIFLDGGMNPTDSSSINMKNKYNVNYIILKKIIDGKGSQKLKNSSKHVAKHSVFFSGGGGLYCV